MKQEREKYLTTLGERLAKGEPEAHTEFATVEIPAEREIVNAAFQASAPGAERPAHDGGSSSGGAAFGISESEAPRPVGEMTRAELEAELEARRSSNQGDGGE